LRKKPTLSVNVAFVIIPIARSRSIRTVYRMGLYPGSRTARSRDSRADRAVRRGEISLSAVCQALGCESSKWMDSCPA
jgi:hypothetical protein